MEVPNPEQLIEDVYRDRVEGCYLDDHSKVKVDLSGVVHAQDRQVAQVLLAVDQAPEHAEACVQKVADQELKDHQGSR